MEAGQGESPLGLLADLPRHLGGLVPALLPGLLPALLLRLLGIEGYKRTEGINNVINIQRAENMAKV